MNLRPSARNGQLVNLPECGDCAPAAFLPNNKEFIVRHCVPSSHCVNEASWAIWLPEIIVGLNDPNEEIAANYARASAVQFCMEALVLQRTECAELDCDGISIIPIWDQEQAIKIVGDIRVRGAKISDEQGLVIQPRHLSCHGDHYRCCAPLYSHRKLEFTYIAVPTELSKTFDAILYERWRAPIAERARIEYIKAYHFRDAEAVRSISPQVARANWRQAVISAQSAVLPFNNGAPWHSKRMSGL